MKPLAPRPTRRPSGWTAALILAAVVFLAGFGGMATLWINHNPARGQIGWTHYRAATVGDGLLLPAFVATLVIARQHLRQKAIHSLRRYVAVTVGAAGVLG